MCLVRPDAGHNFGCEEVLAARQFFRTFSYAGPMASVGLGRFLAPSGGMDLRADFEDLRAEQGRA